MQIYISGLKKVYTSGDIVKCKIDISRGLFLKDKSEICSIDISLAKRIRKDVNTGTYPGTGYNSDGSSYSYTYHTYDTTYDHTVLCKDLTTGMGELGKNEYNKTPRFEIPIDTANSSIVSYLPDPTSGTLLGQIKRETSYGVLVKVKMLKNGKEKELVEFSKFENKMVIPESKPKYVHKFFSDFSLMYKSNTSTFSPGEDVDLKVVVINKTKSINSLKTSITGGLGNDFIVSEKKSFFLKTLPFKMNMSQEEEYSYMKKHFYSKCMNFKFYLPSTLYGEKDREINVDFILNRKYLIRSVPVGTQKQLSDLYEVDVSDDLGDEEEQEIEASDPFMGFPDVPLDKRTLERFKKEEVIRKAKNELIRKRNEARRTRAGIVVEIDDGNKESSLVLATDESRPWEKEDGKEDGKEDDEEVYPTVHFLKNKDIPIHYRVLVNMNDFRRKFVNKN